MKHLLRGLLFCGLLLADLLSAGEILRVFTWSGYVLPEEVDAVNKILKEKGYDITVQVIKPWAEGPEQMYKIIRAGDCDVSFLTLNYIKMQGEKTAKLLQPINVNSPRLTNYAKLNKKLTGIEMGMTGGKPLYIPYGGGAYGIWGNMKKLKETDLPKSINDLFDAKWKGKISLTKGQVQPNIALVMMSLDKPPFYLNDLIVSGKRNEAMNLCEDDGLFQKRTNALYAQVASFWSDVPVFKDEYLLVSCYGIEIAGENAKGGKWKIVKFKEGNTVWMDTMNFMKELAGKKLEAAEIFANYMIGKEVQTRVVEGLSMVSVSTLVASNPLIDEDPDFFKPNMFWQPYDLKADNLMLKLSNNALK